MTTDTDDDAAAATEADDAPKGHVRISAGSRGQTWSVTVHVGATLDEVESARVIAREIADRLAK